MKKVVSLALLSFFVSAGAFAAEKVGVDAARQAHREEMKAIKKKMREEKEKNPSPNGQANGFWAKEGERSGLNKMKAGEFMKNLNPMPFFKQQEEAYNARKTGAAQK